MTDGLEGDVGEAKRKAIVRTVGPPVDQAVSCG
jgi:hypothetical protein